MRFFFLEESMKHDANSRVIYFRNVTSFYGESHWVSLLCIFETNDMSDFFQFTVFDIMLLLQVQSDKNREAKTNLR